MVGSDLEDGIGKGPGGGLNGTKDFKELIQGYESLTDDHPVDVLVAFGGADKDGWRGMKFANMDQIIADGQDGAFGNETAPGAYIYQDDTANMDDEGSLTLFLKYLQDAYPNPEQSFLTFWDHGNSYKGFGGDSNFYPDELSMDEITRAFERSQPGVFDLIGFDACLMASVEVAKVIEPFADYMIASEELEPGHGWLWSEVIRYYAEQDSIVDAGKLMVDNFVKDVHGSGYKQNGRTLSLLDLSRYADMETALNPVLSHLGQYLYSSEYSGYLVDSITKSGDFGIFEKEDSRSSIDLKHFTHLLSENLADTEISSAIDTLIAEIDRFVVHSNQDGSRPYANGVSIAAPEDTDPDYSAYKFSDTWQEFERAYAALRSNDTTAPTIVEHISNETGTTAAFSDEYLAEVSVIYGFIQSVEYPASERWVSIEYDPNEMLAWIPATFNSHDEYEYGQYTVYTAEMTYYPKDSEYSNFAVLNLYVDENMEIFYHSVQIYQEGEDGTRQFDESTYQLSLGDAAQFWGYIYDSDDENGGDWYEATDIITLVREPVFELGEPIEPGDGSIDDVFMVVAELEAQPTEADGEYFIPKWDQYWFTVEYDPNEITAWIPASFYGYGEYEYGPYTIYTAEIDFYIGDSENANPAVLNLYVDEDMQVFDHSIQTYQYIYSGPDDLEGTLRFDKATYRIESGDAVLFWNYGYNLDDPEYNDWFEASDILEFVQEPAFYLEHLEFEDESGQPIQYYYTIWAEDVGGNGVFTELVAVE